MLHDVPDLPDVFIVTPARRDEPDHCRPQLVTRAAGGRAWDQIDPALPSFDRMPPAA